MKTTSALYKTLRADRLAKYEVRVVCGNTTYGMDKLKSVRITSALFDGDGPQIGNTYSDQCELLLMEESANWPRMAAFNVDVRLVKTGDSPTWSNVDSSVSGYNTNKLNVTVPTTGNGMRYRCVVTDGNSNTATSEEATVTRGSSSAFAIVGQPQDASNVNAATVQFHVSVTNAPNATYQWQYKTTTGNWTNSSSSTTGYNTDTVTITVNSTRNGYQYRCNVTSGGVTLTSDPATLTRVTGSALAITSEPVSVAGSAGESVSLVINAKGSNLTYQWQSSPMGASTLTSEWLPMGTFYTDERKADKYGNLSIIGFDAMLKLEQPWTNVPNIVYPTSWPVTASVAGALLETITGFQIDSRTTLDNTVAFIGLDTTSTARDKFGDIAAAMGGNWKITSEGKLYLVPLNAAYPSQNAIDLDKAVVAIDEGDPLDGITSVTLTALDGTVASFGTNTGYNLKGDCDFSHNGVAELCLTYVSGFEYRPFTATGSHLDPAAEVGDIIEVDDKQYYLCSMDWNLGVMPVCKMEAPFEAEVDHEYTVKSETAKALEIVNQVGEDYSSIVQDVNSITAAITVNGGVVSELRLANNVLTWNATNTSMTRFGEFSCYKGTIGCFEIGKELFELYLIPTMYSEPGSGTISYIWEAHPKDEVVDNPDRRDYFKFQLGSVVDAFFQNDIGRSAPAVMNLTYVDKDAGTSTVVLGVSPGGANVQDPYRVPPLVYSEKTITSGGFIGTSNEAYPSANSAFYSQYYGYGTSSGDIWTTYGNLSTLNGDVYAHGSPISGSDKSLKKDIKYEYDKYESLFRKLKPADFKYKDGKSGRTHTGFVVQDVLDAIKECGIEEKDFAPVVEYTPPDSDEKTWGLRYSEFIPMNTHMIQKLMARVDELEARVAELESKGGVK